MRQYVLEMGVSPRLVEMAQKIPSARLHVLTRDEIVQLGIDPRLPFETEWLAYEDHTSKRQFILKAITREAGPEGKEYRTTNIHLSCATVVGYWLGLAYQRELSSREIGLKTVVRLAAGSNIIALQGRGPEGTSDTRGGFADRDFIAKALAAGSIVIRETFSPTDAPEWSREVKMSTSGLERALDTAFKDCSER